MKSYINNTGVNKNELSYIIRTYGCQMNGHESEKLAQSLDAAGWKRLSGDDVTADLIIFNTCVIRNTAEQKIINHIRLAGKQKQANPHIKIAVVGCLGAGAKRFSFVDYWGNYTGLLAWLAVDFTNRGVGKSISIIQGCENFCSYCIVPFVRGKEVSKPIAEIEKEFEQIKDGGGVIWLLGQNVNSYKCPQTGTDFVGLLRLLCSKEGCFRLNFMSSHPKDFSDGLIELIAQNEKIERNIHLPMQSGCDKILAGMNRRYSVAEYKSKIELLRRAVPGVCITTDIICGFPGETEDDFAQTVSAMKEIRFNAAFIFPYSRRSGTAADSMPNQIDEKTKKRRTTELIAIQREISKQNQ